MGINVDINHPSFVQLIDKISNKVSQTIDVKRYFSLTENKKRGLSYVALKVVNNDIGGKIKITENELLSLITILRKKNKTVKSYGLKPRERNIIKG